MNRLPSVTQILGILDKPGLSWAAARETAVYAANHLDDWCTLPAPDAVDKLYKYHRGIWDHRAALGTAVHQINERWARGEEIDLRFVVKAMQTETRIWQTRDLNELVAELATMVDGLEDAWNHLQPETVSVEDVVRYPHPRLGYIGQQDWRVRLPEQSGVGLVDLKTTAQTDPTKGLYFETWKLQLVGYGGCTEIVHYNERTHRPYAKGVEEIGSSPLTRPDWYAILHLRANGRWEWIPLEAGEAEREHFMALRSLHGWLQTDGRRPGRKL